ncbi:MAG: sugar transferase [Marinilabiliaceae bacterium]|nr:sugar transferase [Marinilabiliaceae bacterium]
MGIPKKINYKKGTIFVLICDITIAYILFLTLKFWQPSIEFILPKIFYEPHTTPDSWELILFVFFWISLLGLSGLYRQLREKGFMIYYLHFSIVLFAGHVGFTFFFLTKNEFLYDYGFFHFFFQCFAYILLAFSLPRFLYFNLIYWGMKKQKIAIYAILIGDSEKAKNVFDDFSGYNKYLNYYFIGYIKTLNSTEKSTTIPLTDLGYIDNLPNIINNNEIDEVIVALTSSESANIQKVLNIVKQKDIVIRILPDINAILEGTVKMSNLKGIPLITIRNNLMPVWQMALKNGLDIIGSLLALSICLPFLPIIAIGIATSSKGPIFFTQLRIGKNKRPFKMIKFRSMYIDAEHKGPALSSLRDPRITPFGRVLRKWHIDELPQFINVLLGHMSIVGPRPERQHFIDQILPIAPYYAHLFRIKPGITSWGMVKYGYAENIDQMIERLKYDILYLENMSLLVDLKIIIHTLKSVLIGDGK